MMTAGVDASDGVTHTCGLKKSGPACLRSNLGFLLRQMVICDLQVQQSVERQHMFDINEAGLEL